MRFGYQDLKERSDSGYFESGTRGKGIGSMMMGIIGASKRSQEWTTASSQPPLSLGPSPP